MAKDYEVKIVESWKELSARERISLKNFNDAIQLDSATQDGKIEIKIANYVVCSVHNEMASDNKDYKKIVVIDEDGQRYVTGSPTFYRELSSIIDELAEAGEDDDFTISVYQMDSKNYKGKKFITCNLV